MSIFFTADMHFGHENANTGKGIRQHCDRPFSSIEEMDAKLIENWNSRVSNKDEVYILGDFAWRNHAHYLMAVKGKKHLVQGNHDKMSQDVLRSFTSVGQIVQKAFNGQLIIMCHFPMRSWNARAHKSWHLFGHVHGRLNNTLLPRTLDVGVDTHAFMPWSLDEVVEAMKRWSDIPVYHEVEPCVLPGQEATVTPDADVMT